MSEWTKINDFSYDGSTFRTQAMIVPGGMLVNVIGHNAVGQMTSTMSFVPDNSGYKGKVSDWMLTQSGDANTH